MNVEIYGSDNPTICIISSMNKRSEDYAYLFEELSKRGINENNCKFITFESKNRPVYYSDFIENSKEIENLVNNSNPELVVTVGDNISSYFIGNSFSGISRNNGSVYKREFGINEFKIMPIFHPSYILRKGLQEEYSKTIKKIILIASGSIPDQVISDCNSSSVHEFKDETIICLDSFEFDEFCKEEIDNFDLIAYDIETNAKEKTSKNYEVVGFSLASNSKKGCYVVLDSLDYKMDKIHIKNVEDRLRKILSSKRIMVYNYMHEELATLRWLGIEMENVDDLFCLVKLLMGNADRYSGNGGLKLQCEMNLNTKDWSEDLDLYMEYFRKIGDEENRTKMRNLLLNYYEDHEIDSLINIADEKHSDDSVYSGKVISYGVVPYKLIGKYGGIDSSILFDLKEFYENRINELNKEMGIDLRKGYNNWMCHHIAGYTLERNGAFFDNEKASEVEKWCSSVMVESLSNMIKSSLSEEYLKSKIYPDFLVYLKDNYLVEMLRDNAIPVRLYKSSALISLDYRIKDNKLEELINRMSLTPNKKGQFKLEMGNIETVAKNFLVNYKEIYEDWYKKFINDFNSEKHTVQEMKRLMNPTATAESWKDFLTSIFINDDIRYAKLYNILIEVAESPNFTLDRYSNDDRKLMELVIKLKSLDVDLNKKFKIFCKFFGSERYLRSNYLKRKINEALSYKIESMKECYIIELYNFYTMCGVNIEDKSTWTESFEFLCNLRKYKKASKIITTYINGKIGRNSVWYVDEDSFRNGDKFTTREIQYNDVSDEKEIVNKIPIYQSSFMVDMADTGRWKSGMHCLPAGDTIKQLYTSRFNGGIIAMPDCSQAEVRMLAAVCQDENLLKAFRQEGMDIHKYVASLCFHNGDIDAVTKTERKIAKGAVFGILYGESVESFAESFTHGDLNEANKIFGYFFNSFPKIKEYVEDAHNQFLTTNKISLRMMNRFINLESAVQESGGDKNKVLRQSQNYIIQGQTCDLAGLILYNVCKFIKDNNLKSKPFCFIHDSIEIDIHPDETFLMLDKLKPLFNSYPWETFGVPMASDIVFSSNMGAEIDTVNIDHDEKYNEVNITLEGYEDDINEVIKLWNNVYDVCDLVENEDLGEKYVPNSGLFQEKVTFSKLMGTYRKEVKRTYHVIRKKELLCQ